MAKSKNVNQIFNDTEGDLPLPEGVVFDDSQDLEPELDARTPRQADRHSASRQAGHRSTTEEVRGPTRSELIRRYALEMYSNVLPELPQIEGYHLCWLSTTNPSDSIASREAKGYTRVLPEDIPYFNHLTLNSGPHAGCIGLNEMVLFKLPIDLWEAYMKISHHEHPYSEEEKIRDSVRYVRETAQEGGGDVYLGNGTSEIGRRSRREPTFSE